MDIIIVTLRQYIEDVLFVEYWWSR